MIIWIFYLKPVTWKKYILVVRYDKNNDTGYNEKTLPGSNHLRITAHRNMNEMQKMQKK